MIRALQAPLSRLQKTETVYASLSFSLHVGVTVHTRNRETLSRFPSEPCEFFRVGNDPNCLNTPFLNINGQDGEYLIASADDQGGLTVDFR